MKRLMLIGFAVCALAVLPTLPAAAIPLAPLTPAVTQADDNVMLVAHNGRAPHFRLNRDRDRSWNRARVLPLGFLRSRHRSLR